MTNQSNSVTLKRETNGSQRRSEQKIVSQVFDKLANRAIERKQGVLHRDTLHVVGPATNSISSIVRLCAKHNRTTAQSAIARITKMTRDQFLRDGSRRFARRIS